MVSSQPLETILGYATETLKGVAAKNQPVSYHLNVVWPFEQVTICYLLLFEFQSDNPPGLNPHGGS